MSDDKNKEKGAAPPASSPTSATPPAPAARQPSPPSGSPAPSGRRKVRVLADNLGPKLYKKGQVTDDPDVVALLDDPRGLVEEVKD